MLPLRRLIRGPQPSRPTESAHVALACARDGRAHLVASAVYDAALVGDRGVYLAVCGHTVLVASLLAVPGPPCVLCAEAAHVPVARAHGRPGKR